MNTIKWTKADCPYCLQDLPKGFNPDEPADDELIKYKTYASNLESIIEAIIKALEAVER